MSALQRSRARRIVRAGLVAAALAVPAMLLAPAALAGDAGEAAIMDALAVHRGKQVSVRLSSGEELTGKVAQVNAEVVTLSELAGREYFEAVIRIDAIDAVIARKAAAP